MGEKTGIAWCDATFNCWWGCQKVSPACTNCYAETFDKRVGGDHWGPNSERRFFGEKHWNEPRKWNRLAAELGVRKRVFCASMADVFEDREDLVSERQRLWKLIRETPNLDWLLLTKRPENLRAMVPWVGTKSEPWPNVWLGTTVENQEYADLRIPHLLSVNAVVHFLSCEPLLGKIDLSRWMHVCSSCVCSTCPPGFDEDTHMGTRRVKWVITGSESGHGKRDTNIEWYRELRDQCRQSRAAFFFKQADLFDEVITIGTGSWRKGGAKSTLVELPYLDGVQHAEFPQVETCQASPTSLNL